MAKKICAALLFAVLAIPATAAEPPSPPKASAADEFAAMKTICQLAEWASMIQAKGACDYFLPRYQDAAKKEAELALKPKPENKH